MTANKPKNLDEYIAGFPEETQKVLEQMRACLHQAAPGAEEGLKWGAPAFSYHRILFTFAAFKKHISLYPTPSVVKAFANELSGYVTSSSTIQFPLNKPLPLSLIRRIAAFRVHESIDKDVKWM